MKVLVVGSGGREHALSYRLAREGHEVICAPGNPGIAKDVETSDVSISDLPGISDLAIEREVALVLIGPEDPLVRGLADRLRHEGIPTFGPGAAAARLEGSKAFSKNLMTRAAVPTAGFRTFFSFSEAKEYARHSFDAGIELAVKVSGNALGRGVAVCSNLEEAIAALERAMVKKEFGTAGDTVVLEQRLTGREFSLLTIVGDHNFVHLPIAQDYKRALDNDQGPNTGGMGSYSPCQWATDELIQTVERSMVVPILRELRSTSPEFRGCLFTGVMVTSEGPKCLEYNVRFGDPETQTVMLRIENGFAEALFQAASGAVVEQPKLSGRAAVTVVVASRGYPGSYQKNSPVSIGRLPEDSKLFFAGVSEVDGSLVNSGGRVVGVSAHGKDVAEARRLAYAAVKEVTFSGSYYRSDIAADD